RRDGDDRLLGPSAGAEPEELRAIVTVLGPDRRPGGLYEHRLQPARAFAGARGLSFTGRLVQPPAQTGPGDQVLMCLEARHIEADFAEDRLSDHRINARHRIDARDGLTKRGEHLA